MQSTTVLYKSRKVPSWTFWNWRPFENYTSTMSCQPWKRIQMHVNGQMQNSTLHDCTHSSIRFRTVTNIFDGSADSLLRRRFLKGEPRSTAIHNSLSHNNEPDARGQTNIPQHMAFVIIRQSTRQRVTSACRSVSLSRTWKEWYCMSYYLRNGRSTRENR